MAYEDLGSCFVRCRARSTGLYEEFSAGGNVEEKEEESSSSEVILSRLVAGAVDANRLERAHDLHIEGAFSVCHVRARRIERGTPAIFPSQKTPQA